VSQFRRNGGWVAKFQLNGDQVWVPGGPWPTKSAAREAEQRHRDFLTRRRTDETCASFGERWLEEWARPADATRRQYRDAIKRFSEHFGDTRLDSVERLSARTWALSVPRYVSRAVGTMYEDARNVGLVEHNPFSNLRLPPTERTEQIVPPSLDELREILNACPILGGYAQEFRAMVQFAAWTGVRAGELQALRWEDVGTDTITIRRARKRDGSEKKPKNGRERTIAFLPPARVLDDLPRREDGYVFHSPRGKALDQGSLFYAWRVVRASAGVTRIRWHDWRHFCATQLLELGLDHFAVSIQLGHTDGGALVMARYGHPSEEAARKRLLGAFELDSDQTGSSTGSQLERVSHGRAG
jgi:integrase